MKPEDEKKMMELHERELIKRLEKRYGQPPSTKVDESTQARRISESVNVSDPLKTPEPKRDTRREVARQAKIPERKLASSVIVVTLVTFFTLVRQYVFSIHSPRPV